METLKLKFMRDQQEVEKAKAKVMANLSTCCPPEVVVVTRLYPTWVLVMDTKDTDALAVLLRSS